MLLLMKDSLMTSFVWQLGNSTQIIFKALENSLESVGLRIAIKLYNTKFTDQQIEFWMFFTNPLRNHHSYLSRVNMSKKTAIDRAFINGTSYQPIWVFQSTCVVASEARHVRRICKDKIDYYTTKTLTLNIIRQANS